MTWGEAIRLVSLLRKDPSSAVTAAMAGFDYPFSREFAVLADMFDQRHRLAGAKDAKPYPRPFERPDARKNRRGTPKPLSEAVALLNARGHHIKT